jgi:hypothetical protein
MKYIHRLLVLTAFTFPGILLNAQKTDGGVAFNGGVGLSMFGILGSINLKIPDEVTIESDATPCFTGALDFGMQNKLSIGVAGGYQSYDQLIKNYSYLNDDLQEVIGEFSYSLTRINAGVRVLYHFGNDNIDAYTGIKPGVNIYQFEAKSDIVVPEWIRTDGTTFTLQVIPIGLRAYLNDHIGIFFETGIGAPSFVSAGICLGFEKQPKR